LRLACSRFPVVIFKVLNMHIRRERCGSQGEAHSV
jgi:hypothetical protein